MYKMISVTATGKIYSFFFIIKSHGKIKQRKIVS